tara:strand:+ start:29756 stop:30118 length:363 start_codon:yes stop_codon:yes gene_type:complete
MNEQGSQGIKFCDVVDINKRTRTIHVRGGNAPGIESVVLEKSPFALFKFKAVQWIKKQNLPENRCWYFETESKDGVWSLEKERNLIEKRKSKKEKLSDKIEEQDWNDLVKWAKNGLSKHG